MFTLTRPHRQVLATMALLALSVAPTVYVAVLTWRINRPGYVRDVEIALGRQLGLQVSLESVRHPRPGEDVLTGVVLRQEEPGSKATRLTEVARADRVHVVRLGSSVSLNVSGLRLLGESPEMAMAQAELLLRRAGGLGQGQLSLIARHGRVELGREPRRLIYPLRDIAAILRPQADTTRLSASYLVVVDGRPNRCELSLTRRRRADGARMALTFKTMDGPTSARVLDPFFDSVAWLGPAARVEGSLSLSQSDGSCWDAEFQGRLSEVDLTALVNQRFSRHRLQGQASIEVESAHWGTLPAGQGQGWTEARGTLRSGQGRIGRELLQAMASEMNFRLSPQTGTSLDLDFQTLGLSFALTSSGEIQLGGALGAEFAPEAVLVQDGRVSPLARAPEGAANVRGLWKALFPTDADVLVPATAESQVLRHLPLPPGLPGASTTVQAN